MSWTANLIIGELRPWPDAVRVVRGNTNEKMQMLYTITPLPHFWTGDGTLHIEPRKLPERIDVTLPDERGREVHSARVHRFVPERTCCYERNGGLFVCSNCGRSMWRYEGKGDPLSPPNFCPRCGARVEVDA